MSVEPAKTTKKGNGGREGVKPKNRYSFRGGSPYVLIFFWSPRMLSIGILNCIHVRWRQRSPLGLQRVAASCARNLRRKRRGEEQKPAQPRKSSEENTGNQRPFKTQISWRAIAWLCCAMHCLYWQTLAPANEISISNLVYRSFGFGYTIF